MRPIDADELFGMESILATAARSPESRVLMEQVLYDIQHVPTIDVAPVVHARWIPVWKNLFAVKHFRCSACGCKEEESGWAYCHCGARMDAREVER